MSNTDAFPTIFARLKAILQPFSPPLVIQTDTAEHYALTLAQLPKAYPQGFFVGAVQINKNYVSFHLMPVYMHPDLLAQCSPELKKHMQGKSCFNFTNLDEPLLTELAQLTASSIARFRQAPIA